MLRRSFLPCSVTSLACSMALTWSTASALVNGNEPGPQATVVIVQGAAGEEAFGQQFAQWRARWEQAAKKGGAKVVAMTPSTDDVANEKANDKSKLTDRDRLKASLDAESKPSGEQAKQTGELWLVLIGHGTYDGKTARFNLAGPDVSADELAAWLPVGRPVAVINCSSSSGPFMNKLAVAGSRRVVVTATKSGSELNFSRFGDYLSRAIDDLAADLDKDGQTSLLEAYLLASRQTQEWYKEENRLATEHALIDDNGDGLGTPAEFFRGTRAVKRAKDGATLDGLRAAQWRLVPSENERRMPPELRARRDELEFKIAELREKKAQLGEDIYYQQLEVLMVELVNVYGKPKTLGEGSGKSK